MSKLILKISALSEQKYLEEENIECFILSTELPTDFIKNAVNSAVSKEKIILLEGHNADELCIKLGADGIVADLTGTEAIQKEMAKLHQKIGKRFLGIICRNRRHEAMIVSENDPDFIIFKIWNDGKEKSEELIKWYNEFFLLQMAVQPEDNIVDFSSFPADIFILNTDLYKILVDKK